jgi:hypothetical protein
MKSDHGKRPYLAIPADRWEEIFAKVVKNADITPLVTQLPAEEYEKIVNRENQTNQENPPADASGGPVLEGHEGDSGGSGEAGPQPAPAQGRDDQPRRRLVEGECPF